ncbi:MAG: hypothetical protein AAF682_12300 [Planctomycetota bacterium]
MSRADDRNRKLAEQLARLAEGGDAAEDDEVERARRDVEALGRLLDERADPAEAAMLSGMRRALDERRAAPPRARWPRWAAAAAAAAVLAFGFLWTRDRDDGTDPHRTRGGASAVRCAAPLGAGLGDFGAFRIEAELLPSWSWTLRIFDGAAAEGAPPLHVIEDLETTTWDWRVELNALPEAIRWEARLLDAGGQLVGSDSGSASR